MSSGVSVIVSIEEVNRAWVNVFCIVALSEFTVISLYHLAVASYF